MKNITLMVASVSLVILSACASQPVYKEMRTMENAMQEEHIKPGMAITKSGAVVHIDVEEVQAREKRLIAEKAELEQALKNLNIDKANTEEKYRTLRIYVGLSPNEPKPKGKCCDKRGNIEGFEAAPTLDEELMKLKLSESSDSE